jgi:hypothetical protein
MFDVPLRLLRITPAIWIRGASDDASNELAFLA